MSTLLDIFFCKAPGVIGVISLTDSRIMKPTRLFPGLDLLSWSGNIWRCSGVPLKRSSDRILINVSLTNSEHKRLSNYIVARYMTHPTLVAVETMDIFIELVHRSIAPATIQQNAFAENAQNPAGYLAWCWPSTSQCLLNCTREYLCLYQLRCDETDLATHKVHHTNGEVLQQHSNDLSGQV